MNNTNLPKLTPSTATELLSNMIQRNNHSSYVELTGIYKDIGKKEYSGFFYDELKDRDSGKSLKIRLGKSLKADMKSGSLYALEGILSVKTSNFGNYGFDIVFEPSRILGRQPVVMSDQELQELDAKNSLIRERANRGARSLRDIFLSKYPVGETVRGYFIYGTQAITDQDVKAAMSGAENLINLEQVDCRISMAAPGEMVKKLRSLDSKVCDFVAIVRGGGDGQEVFDSLDLARAVLECKIPVFVSIGHKADHHLVDSIADMSFQTPTELGSEILRTAEQVALRFDEEAQKTKAIIGEKLKAEQAEHIARLKQVVDEKAKLLNRMEEGLKERSANMVKEREIVERDFKEKEAKMAKELEDSQKTFLEYKKEMESAMAELLLGNKSTNKSVWIAAAVGCALGLIFGELL